MWLCFHIWQDTLILLEYVLPALFCCRLYPLMTSLVPLELSIKYLTSYTVYHF
jgi:hypothetical protein